MLQQKASASATSTAIYRGSLGKWFYPCIANAGMAEQSGFYPSHKHYRHLIALSKVKAETLMGNGKVTLYVTANWVPEVSSLDLKIQFEIVTLKAYSDLQLELEALLNLHPSTLSFSCYSPIMFHILSDHDGNNKSELLYFDCTWETQGMDVAHQY